MRKAEAAPIGHSWRADVARWSGPRYERWREESDRLTAAGWRADAAEYLAWSRMVEEDEKAKEDR